MFGGGYGVRDVCIASNNVGCRGVPEEASSSCRSVPSGIFCWKSVGLGGVSCPDLGGIMPDSELLLVERKVSAVGIACIA
jgi:hypothetical protein